MRRLLAITRPILRITGWLACVLSALLLTMRENTPAAIAFWILAVVFGIWPAVFLLRRLLKKKRYAAGLCPASGYDLRASPNRCPECGRAVADRRG